MGYKNSYIVARKSNQKLSPQATDNKSPTLPNKINTKIIIFMRFITGETYG